MDNIIVNHPTPYSNRELEHYFTDLGKRLDNQDATLKAIDSKVGIQNGRVTRIEQWSNDARVIIEDNMKTLGQYRSDKVKIVTAISILTLLGAGIITLAIYAINAKISQGITDALASYDIQVNNISH